MWGRLSSCLSQARGDSDAFGEVGALGLYLVENGLDSASAGVAYRRSPSLRDIAPNQVAPYGTVRAGELVDREWLKVGRLYLPVHIGGRAVLRLLRDHSLYRVSDASSGVQLHKERDPAHGMDKYIHPGAIVVAALEADGWLRTEGSRGPCYLRQSESLAELPLRCRYRVENEHGSKLPGVNFRTPNVEDKVSKGAKYGDCHEGVPHDEDWLRIGNYFLPVKIRRVYGHPLPTGRREKACLEPRANAGAIAIDGPSHMLPTRRFNPEMSSTRCIHSPVSKLSFTKSSPQLRIDVDRPGKKHHACPDPGQLPGMRSSQGTPA